MKLVSIVIPTNKAIEVRRPLLQSIAGQTYLKIEVVLLIDRTITNTEFDTISTQVHKLLDSSTIQVSLITTRNTIFKAGRGASYVRNFGIEVAQGDYIQYMDDDGILEADYVARMVSRYEEGLLVLGKEYIASPTIMYRDSGQIQSQGFDRVWWMICWPEPHGIHDFKTRLRKALTKHFVISAPTSLPYASRIACMGAMGLFAPRHLVQVIKFDEQFEFVYEDLDMTLRATQAGVPLIVRHDIRVAHMEAAKTLAQVSFVGSPRSVYLKSRNRILFVRNNASRRAKVLFYGIGLPLHLVWFGVMIMVYGSQRSKSWLMLIKGTWDGIITK